MGQPTEVRFYQVIAPPGVVAVVAKEKDPWPLHMALTDTFLEYADPEYVLVGDGMVRFVLSNGDTALYGIVHADPVVGGVDHYDLLRCSP